MPRATWIAHAMKSDARSHDASPKIISNDGVRRSAVKRTTLNAMTPAMSHRRPVNTSATRTTQ